MGLLDRLSGWGNETVDPESDPRLPGMLSDAMAAGFHAFRTEARLERYLRTLAPAFRDPVRSRIRTIDEEVYVFLEAWPERIGTDEAFPPFFVRLLSELRARHPWISGNAEKALENYVAWFVWHEGY